MSGIGPAMDMAMDDSREVQLREADVRPHPNPLPQDGRGGRPSLTETSTTPAPATATVTATATELEGSDTLSRAAGENRGEGSTNARGNDAQAAPRTRMAPAAATETASDLHAASPRSRAAVEGRDEGISEASAASITAVTGESGESGETATVAVPAQPVLATTQVAPRPIASQAPSTAGSIGGLVFAMILVVSLILVLGWMAKRIPGLGGRGASGGLRVVASLPIGARERVVVVEVGQTQLLLGVGPGGTRTLHTLDQPLPDAGATPTPQFAQLLAQHFGKKA